MDAETPRTHVHLPGFTFDGYGERSRLAIFGAGVAFDVYTRRGHKTAELTQLERQEMAALASRGDEDPRKGAMMYTRRAGVITIYMAVR